MDFDLLLDEASLPETEVPLCLNGKLRAQYDTLAARIEARRAEQAATELPADDRLASKGPAPDPEQPELDRLIAEMRRYTQVFVVRAMPRPDWNRLFAEHPPRRDPKTGKLDPRDVAGINYTTFYPALVRACVVVPEMSADRWDRLDKVLTDAQFDRLAVAAWNVNRREDDIPFSPSGLPDPPSSDGN
jgi:hypothetical protein